MVMTVKEKFEKFMLHHPDKVFYNDEIEFCFCQDNECNGCALIVDCADDPISHMPPFVTQEEFSEIKKQYPEFFI